MPQWKIFKRSEEKKQTNTEPSLAKAKTEEDKKQKETPKQEKPIKEYSETLYSIDVSKPVKKYDEETKEPMKRTSWESSRTIELNIDQMRKNQKEHFVGDRQKNIDVERKVDQIFLKKKTKP